MLNSIGERLGLKLTLIFGSAGAADRAWTKMRVACAGPKTRAKLIDGYFDRWERRLLDAVESGTRELEVSGKHADLIERRKTFFQPELRALRNNKATLLYS